MNQISSIHRGIQFIDPEILSGISNLELLARTVVEGFISGLHRSPYRGFSVEFLSYRPYIPGDDPMHIDWKLYARSDKLFIKQFQDETNTSCHILLDISNSMQYSSKSVTKLRYGSILAASLAYFMIRQRDSVGLYLFDNEIREKTNTKSTQAHLFTILHCLEKLYPAAKTEMGRPFHELADSIKKRGIVIIISDLLEEPETIINGLKHFRFSGNDVIVFQIFDPAEVNFHFKDIMELEDMETGEKIIIMADEAKNMYLNNLEQFKAILKDECGLLGIDYNILETNQPLDYALFHYLSARSSRK
jgi:uncharacterized protein (DUF58 family)